MVGGGGEFLITLKTNLLLVAEISGD